MEPPSAPQLYCGRGSPTRVSPLCTLPQRFGGELSPRGRVSPQRFSGELSPRGRVSPQRFGGNLSPRGRVSPQHFGGELSPRRFGGQLSPPPPGALQHRSPGGPCSPQGSSRRSSRDGSPHNPDFSGSPPCSPRFIKPRRGSNKYIDAAAAAGTLAATPAGSRGGAEPRELVLSVLHALELDDSQLLATQDPFVKAELVRTGATARSDYVWGGGTSPDWEKHATDGNNVLRLSWSKKLPRSNSISCSSLERQNAESFPNALLLEVVNQNFCFDDKLAFCVLNFSEDREFVWLEQPAADPSKKRPARIADGPITLSLAQPVEVSVGEGALSSRRQRGAGKLVVRLHFE